MRNPGTLYLVIGLLVIGIGVTGYYLYREQHKSGIEVEVDGSGISVETN